MNNGIEMLKDNKINSNSPKKKMLLKGMTLDELKDYFVKNGENKYRGEQVFKWMYDELVTNFDKWDKKNYI